MNQTLTQYAAPLGRFLLAFVFLASAFNKITDFSGTTGYMAASGMTVATSFFLAGAIVFLVVGGLSLLLGFQARIGALLLIVFLIPTTLIFHGFWKFEGDAAQMQMIQFMKNCSILGGLFMVVAQGSGACSLDSYLKKG